MAPLRMLMGQWAVQGRDGEISFEAANPEVMVGKARPLTGKWRRFMVLYEEGKPAVIRADFFDSKDHATHYRLTESDANTLRFTDEPGNGGESHTLTYTRQGPDRLAYRFETGTCMTDSGILVRAAIVRPLQ